MEVQDIKRAVFSYLDSQGVEWVYLLSDLKIRTQKRYGIPIPCATFKIGFTGGNNGHRQNNVAQSVKDQYGAKIYKVMSIPAMSAKHIEREMHQLFANDSTGVYSQSSGGSEWFSRPNWLVFNYALVIGIFYTPLPSLTVLFYSFLILFVPIPLDAIVRLYLQWIITELRRSFFYAIVVLFSLANIVVLIKAFLLIV